MKNIIIFGGGISGLTVAHELLEQGFNITLFEKDNALGGMARSRREFGNVPSEHSWRGYAPFYKNTFEIMKRIPVDNKNKTVYDNLTIPIDFHLMRDRVSTYKPKLNIIDYIILFYYGLKYLISNNRRNDYYETKLVPLLKNKLSEDGYDRLIEFIVGPGLGMEKKDVSYGHLFKVITLQTLNQKKYIHIHTNSNKTYTHYAKDAWHVLNAPTSEAWFEPWKKYLINRGLKIYLHTKLIKFNFKNNKIISCVINDGLSNRIVKADEYILCINPFEAQKVFERSQMNILSKQHNLLNKNTISNQISFRFGLNKKIKFPSKSIAFVMPDSEFNITWYPQEYHWDSNIELDNNKNIKSLWSGTVIETYGKSKLYGKNAINLNKKELTNDIIYQILRSKNFQKLIYENNGFYLNKNDIIYTEIWYEWSYNNGELSQYNKKWVNNIFNQKFRQKQNTNYKNLYVGGAHTDTTINIWSIEGAIESGKIISNSILQKYKKKKIILYDHLDPIYFNSIKLIDDILYEFNLPNLLDIFILSIIVFICYTIYKKCHN